MNRAQRRAAARAKPQTAAIEIAAFLMGGPFGIIASMWAHRRWMK